MSPLRFIKISLVILSSAVAVVSLVWFGLMVVLKQPAVEPEPVAPVPTATTPTATQSEPATTTAGADIETQGENGVTVDVSALPSAQKKVLQSFGFSGDAIYFSAAAIICAREAVGEERFAEIVEGAIPGPLEATKLYQCTKR